MSSCIFTKNGLLDGKAFIEKNPIHHINHHCEIEEGVTLKNIMNVVAKDSILATIVSVYSDVNDIKGFNEEVNRKSKRDSELDHIRIYWSGQIIDKSLSLWSDWEGVRKRAKKNEGKTVGLSYTPLYEIAHLPVKLDTKLQIWEFDKNEPSIDYIYTFTLLDILHAIYYDISFHGGPKQRNEFWAEMSKTVKNIAKDL